MTAINRFSTPAGRAARKNREGGFSLVEVLVAVAIMAMMIISVVQLFIMSAYTSRLVEEQTRISGLMERTIQELQRVHLDTDVGVTADSLTILITPNEAELKTAQRNDIDQYKTYVKGMVDAKHALVVVPGVQSALLNGQAAFRMTFLGDSSLTPPNFTDTRTQAKNAIDGGQAVTAVIYWFVETIEGGQAHRVTVHVDTGYLLNETSVLRQATLAYTSIFPPKEWYQGRNLP